MATLIMIASALSRTVAVSQICDDGEYDPITELVKF